MTGRSGIEIPRIMRTLERDARGYPIPFIVKRINGVPQFAINETPMIMRCVRQKLCSVCGKKLKEYWMIGGSRAFLHPDGVFGDSPVHLECAEYALQVCPFLAAPRWTKSVSDAKKIKTLPIKVNVVEFSGSIQPERFGLGLVMGYPTVTGDPGVYRFWVDGWQFVEWWRNGERVNAPDTAILE